MRRMQGPVYLMNSQSQADTMTVFRAGEVVWSDGKPVETAVESYEMTGNVQPLNGEDLLLVPEAQRSKDNVSIFTEQNKMTPKLNDRILIDGHYYQVQNVTDWGTYTQLRAMREDAKATR